MKDGIDVMWKTKKANEHRAHYSWTSSVSLVLHYIISFSLFLYTLLLLLWLVLSYELVQLSTGSFPSPFRPSIIFNALHHLLFATDALFIATTLSLLPARPVINPFLFGELREGMRTTVVCSVLSGEQSEPLDISWFKDSQPLKIVHPEAELLRMGLYISRSASRL